MKVRTANMELYDDDGSNAGLLRDAMLRIPSDEYVWNIQQNRSRFKSASLTQRNNNEQ